MLANRKKGCCICIYTLLPNSQVYIQKGCSEAPNMPILPFFTIPGETFTTVYRERREWRWCTEVKNSTRAATRRTNPTTIQRYTNKHLTTDRLYTWGLRPGVYAFVARESEEPSLQGPGRCLVGAHEKPNTYANANTDSQANPDANSDTSIEPCKLPVIILGVPAFRVWPGSDVHVIVVFITRSLSSRSIYE